MKIDQFCTINNTLSVQQLREAETFFVEIRGDVEHREEVWGSLHKQFVLFTPEEIFSLRHSYTKWYTLLSFDLLLSLKKDDVVSVFSQVSCYGFLYDIDVLKNMYQYLQSCSVDQADMEQRFGAIRDSFVASSGIMCRLKGHPLSFSSFYNTVSLYEQKNDNLALANYYSDIDTALRKDATEVEMEVDSKTILYLFQESIHFLQGVTAENIFYIVDPYFYPQKYTQKDTSTLQSKPPQPAPSAVKQTEKTVTTPPLPPQPQPVSYTPATPASSQSFFDAAYTHIPDFVSWMSTEDAQQLLLVSMHGYADVDTARKALGQKLISLFPDVSHESTELIHTLLGLDEFLKEQGFSGQHDFLYFDDQDTTFHWDPYYLTA